jgi:hypothetical protein
MKQLVYDELTNTWMTQEALDKLNKARGTEGEK